MRPALVIFDCDGVLVDTGSVDTRVLSEIVTAAGWPMSPAEVNRRFKGMASVKIWAQVAAELGRPLRPDIEEQFRQRQLLALEGEVQLVAGVEALLDALPIPYCVASNGPHRKMEATLGATGLLRRFEGRVFSRTGSAPSQARSGSIPPRCQCHERRSGCVLGRRGQPSGNRGSPAGFDAAARFRRDADRGCRRPCRRRGRGCDRVHRRRLELALNH